MAAIRQMKAGRTARAAAPAGSSPLQLRTQQEDLALAWDRVLEVARRRLDQFVALEPKVLKGDDPEAIHDIRVASRRLQQVFDLLYPAPRSQKVRKLRRTIRGARRVLSVVRNCDVLLGRTERAVARKRTSRRGAWLALREYLRAKREQSFRKASRRLSKRNLSAFYVRLRDHVESSTQAQSHAAPQPGQQAIPIRDRNALFRAQLEAALREAWSSLESRVAQAQEMWEPGSLHAVRIGAKKVRYLIEVIDELEVAGSERALAFLRRLQKHLGDWHDLEVQEEMMLEMAGRPAFLRDRLELAMEVERLVLQNRRRKKAYDEKFSQMAGTKDWRQLREWVERPHFAESRGNGRESYSPAFPPVTT